MKLLLAIATIIGTVIGAGILGLPYALSVAGFIPGLFLTLIIGFSMTMLLLYLGEVVLRCREVLQLPGLVRKYLGRKTYYFTLVLFIISISAALISYIIGVSESAASILMGGQSFYMILFIGLMSVPVIKGVNFMDDAQLILVSFILTFILIITFMISPQVNFDNLLVSDLDHFFFPFGVIFFALTGYSVMPELEQILLKRERLYLPSVLIAMIACTIIYLIFSGVFIGVYGQGINQVSTQSLSGWLGLLGKGIAVFGMTTSFMGLGVALSDVFKKDLGYSNIKAWALTCLPPLIISLLFQPSFIQPILISGAYTGTVTGFIIIGLWHVARKKRGVKPAFKAPFGSAGAIIVSLILIMGLVMTTLDLIGLL